MNSLGVVLNMEEVQPQQQPEFERNWDKGELIEHGRFNLVVAQTSQRDDHTCRHHTTTIYVPCGE